MFIDWPVPAGHDGAMRALLFLPASLLLSGCYTVARTAVDVVTLPVKAVSAGVDASRIDVNAFGDTKLKYGARDGRNRRVAIEATK